MLLAWLAYTAGTGRAGFGGLGTLTEGLDEPVEILAVGFLYLCLLAPGRGDDWGGKVFGRAYEEVVSICRPVAEVLYLAFREVFGVGDPDRPVLQTVYGVLVWNRLWIVSTVLPDGIVLAARRRILVVIDLVLGVTTGFTDIDILDRVRWGARRFLSGVYYGEKNETPDKQRRYHPDNYVRTAGAAGFFVYPPDIPVCQSISFSSFRRKTSITRAGIR